MLRATMNLTMSEVLMNDDGGKNCITNARRPKTGNVSKADTRYWLAKVKRPRYVKDGKMVESADFAVSIQFRGKRINWSLGTPNKTAAATMARDIFLSLRSSGWDATIARYRPEMAEKVASPTVAQFLEAVEATGSIRNGRTLGSYARALRRIAADVTGIPRSAKIIYDRTSGHAEWLERVGRVKLGELTQDRLQRWKNQFVRRAGDDPRKEESARTSVNSLIRSAGSLFSPRVLKHLGTLEMPEPLPFSQLDFEPQPRRKYKSGFDVERLIQDAKAELDDEPLKIFLLGISAGLRRGEIDNLLWDSFLWDQNIIRVQATKYWKPKTDESSGDVQVDPDVMEIFRGFRPRATGEFVIESDHQPRVNLNWHEYRCKKDFKKLTAWLRTKGLPSKSPLHTLRKEFGSLVNRGYGIHAASMMLRHSNLAVTASTYVDHRVYAVVKIGHLLKGDEAKVIPMQFESEQSEKRSLKV
jgi:integrase